MIYLFCFIVSAGFAFFASRAENRKKFYILSFLSIAVMVTVAGLRDYNVGIDTYNYLTKDEYWAGAVNSNSLWDYFVLHFSLGYGEPLFTLLVGVIARLTGNYQIFLIICHTIILVCIYIGIFRFEKYINPAFVLLIFYFFFYNHTLNGIRQFMAMAIVFVFLADIQEKKYLRYISAVIIATLIHTTAIIALGILVIYFLLYYQNGKINLNISIQLRMLIISLVLLEAVVMFVPLVRFAIQVGILNDRYDFFLTDDRVEPALIIMGIAALGLICAFFFRKSMIEKNKFSDFYIMCSIAYFILLQLTFTIAFSKRIALHFAFADIITIGLVANAPQDRKVKKIVYSSIIAVAFLYWFYVYILRNASQTFPYVMGI